MAYFRSIIFVIGQIIITILCFPITLFEVFLPAKNKMSLVKIWGWLTIKWLKIACHLDFRVIGLDNLPNSPFVATVKHQSEWETIVLLYLLPPHCWVLKKELLRIPILGWGLAMSGPIAIDRKQSKKSLVVLLKKGKEKIEQGLSVVICPEGTRMPPGKKGKYNPGGCLLAKKMNVPILPIAHDAGTFWPKNSVIKQPGTITLVIGKPITSDDKSVRELNDLSQNWIEATVNELQGFSLKQTEITNQGLKPGQG